MKAVESTDQVKELLAAVRARRQGFITDFFPDEEKNNLWIRKGVFRYTLVNGSVFLFKQNDGFCNAFFATTTAEALAADLKQLNAEYPEQKLIFDIVGRTEQCEVIASAFESAGYHAITSLTRMNRVTPPAASAEDSAVAFASAGDVPEISALLHAHFDEEKEQIPYDEELAAFAQNRQILTLKENGVTAGILIYEKNPSTLYLRYWLTLPEFRDKKVGSRLLRAFFESGKDTRRQQLWVIRDNENAIKRYRHYGFAEENMTDIVMSNK